MRFFIDDDGNPRAVAAPPKQALGWFLEDDVQGAPNSCRLILEEIERVERGEIDMWEGTGNAHTVTVRPDGVTIVNEFADDSEPAEVSVDEFRVALTRWRDLILTLPER